MSEYRRKKTFARLLASPAVLALCVVVLGFSVRSVWSAYEKARAAKVSLADTERQYESLQSRQAYLKQATAYLSTDRGREEELRDRYNVAKNGEEMVIVVSDPNAATNTAEKTGGFWSKVIDFFK